MFGSGAESAELVRVGEQRGDAEDLTGEPFVGPVGQILDRALAEVGIDRDSAYVTNAVKHFKWRARGPKRIHDKPSWSEQMACKRCLQAELDLVRPRALVLLGATAAESLLGKDFRDTRSRGMPIESDLAELVVATIHPSAVLRATDREAAFNGLVSDLRLIAKHVRSGPAPHVESPGSTTTR